MTVEKLPFNYTFDDVNPRYRLLYQVNEIFSKSTTAASPPLLQFLSIMKQRFCTACSLIAINDVHGQSPSLDQILHQLRQAQDDGMLNDYVAGYNSDTDETFLSVSLPKSISLQMGESYALVLWRKGRLFTPEDVIIARTALIVFFSKYQEFAKTKNMTAYDVGEAIQIGALIPEDRRLHSNTLCGLYEEALDMVCKCVVITETDGTLVHLNRAAQMLLQRGEVTGNDEERGGLGWVAGLLHPDDVSKLVNQWNTATSTGEAFNTDFRLQMESKELYHMFRCFARPVKRNGGNTGTQWIFVMYDMEQQRLVEESRQAASRKTKFLAEMSHEIRTPLACVIGTCSLLRYTPLNKEQSELLNTIRVSSQQLFTLTNNILDLAKIEESKLILESRIMCLERVLSEVIDIFVPELARKDVDAALNICFPEVPEMIMSDEARLRQAMTNVLSNAIKFTAEHSTIVMHVRKVDSDCSSNQTCPKLQFEVEDEGPGIPEWVPPSQLFDTFVQLDASTSRKYGGSGLGLTISKKLVNLLGGEIWYEGQIGKGTKMMFTIDLKEPTAIELADFQPALLPDPPSSFRHIHGLREFLSTLSSAQPNNLLVFMRKDRMTDYIVRLFRKAGNQLNINVVDEGALDSENVLITEMINYEPVIIITDVLRHTEVIKKAIKEKLCKAVIFLDDQNDKISLSDDREVRSLRKPVKPNTLIKVAHECLLGVLTTNELQRTPLDSSQSSPPTASRWLSSASNVSSVESTSTARPVVSQTTSSFAINYPLRLMLAEDNLLNQQLMTRILNKYSYTDVVVVDNGRQAAEVFARLAGEGDLIEAIFMDMQMPEIEGPEATELIRKYCAQADIPQPHIMALTAKAFSEDRAECLRAGMCTYLSKPIRWSTLEEELIRAFQSVHDRVRCACNEDRIENELESSHALNVGQSTGLDV